MNGEKAREFEGVATRSATILSLRHGGRLDLESGQRLDVVEDSFGNLYHHDQNGTEFYVGNVVEEAE